jgi:hypothetical protein
MTAGVIAEFADRLVGSGARDNGKMQYAYKFANGYGASVAWDSGYGWNVAIIAFSPDATDWFDFRIAKNRPVVNYDDPGAAGFVNDEVERTDGPDSEFTKDLLVQISNFPQVG